MTHNIGFIIRHFTNDILLNVSTSVIVRPNGFYFNDSKEHLNVFVTLVQNGVYYNDACESISRKYLDQYPDSKVLIMKEPRFDRSVRELWNLLGKCEDQTAFQRSHYIRYSWWSFIKHQFRSIKNHCH
ncbi:unnamed protein product [Adineta ricciae]|uniref:Uncharacterized protein n=1 Tax=Adineta ricciae TaxID=249248 RepID=A0A814EIL4_ADIRI|nr:unnamed protein product [Adineta ricciae]CAF1378468.1 unnamed protein product [Adineta ricciae]